MPITGKDLINHGIQPSPQFKKYLEFCNEYQSTHHDISDTDVIKLAIEQLRPTEIELLTIRRRTFPLQIALQFSPDNEAEQLNHRLVSDNMESICQVPVVTGASVMPDACPAGPGITVGGVIECNNSIIPAAHSADICCSMHVTLFKKSDKSIAGILNNAMYHSHFGPGSRHNVNQPDPEKAAMQAYVSERSGLPDQESLKEFMNGNPFLKDLQDYAWYHMGTQGDGNHFLSLGEFHVTKQVIDHLDRLGYYNYARNLSTWVGQTINALTTHHGSRGLGAKVYQRGLTAAVKHTRQVAKDIPDWGAWIDASSDTGKLYWEALQWVGEWTRLNHQVIHDQVLRACGKKILTIGNQHNYVWKKPTVHPDRFIYVHGKGATPVTQSNIGVIPLNMAAPILLTGGKGNQYLDFAPHGAGRNMSRTATIKANNHGQVSISDEDAGQIVSEQTSGLDIRWFSGKPDISESPLGYKDAAEIEAQIRYFELTEIWGKISPLGCIMAGSPANPRSWKKPKAVDNTEVIEDQE